MGGGRLFQAGIAEMTTGLLVTTPDQTRAILGAMRDVATGLGRYPFSAASASSLRAADRYALAGRGDVDPARLSSIGPDALAAVLADAEMAEMAVRFLAVSALVDGELSRPRIDAVLEYARRLGVQQDYVTELSKSVDGDLQWVLTDMSRQNVLSLWNEPWDERVDINDVFLPYRGSHGDPILAARYHALSESPSGTLGKAFSEIYRENGYAYPGEERAVNVRFATPHDATHVLSGYDTSPRGEILVSTFTAGMHPVRPMEGHILPVLYSWHLNIKINDVAGAAKGQLDPGAFWEAWSRGARTSVDLFSPSWDFWTVAHEPVIELRRRYGVLALSANGRR
jgi:hypothetical protein